MSLAAVHPALLCRQAGADPPGWKLVWADKFDRLDTGKWVLVDNQTPTNNSKQDYLPGQVSVRRGKLVIRAEDRPSRGLPFRSGQLISKAEQKHGRWEVRAKMPTSRGMWPAIWLLPDTDRFPWPSGGEIDIVENRGNQPHVTSSAFHYGTQTPYLHKFVFGEQRSVGSRGPSDYHNSFHTYAVDWTKDQLRFYVDGVNHLTVYDEDVSGFLSKSTEPMRLMINNAIGGDFLPDPDQTTEWPQEMEVDWVKVYKPAPASHAAAFTNGDFEAYGGSLYGWSVFGNRLEDSPNVSVTRAAAAEAERGAYGSLKLFGTFSPESSFSGVSQGITVDGGETVTAAADVLVLSTDSLAGSDNTAVLKIEFYDRFGGKYGSARMVGEESLVVAEKDSGQDVWRRHRLTRRAPTGAKEARVSIVFCQPGTAGGAAYFDNVSLEKQPRSKAQR